MVSRELNGTARWVGNTPALHPPLALAVIIERATAERLDTVLKQLRPELASYVVYLLPDGTENPAPPELRITPSELPAVYASNGQSVQRGQVTVLPHGVPWKLEGGRLLTTGDEGARAAPMRSLLRSAAREHGPNLVVVVLTDLDRESSAGLRAVSESGGAILAAEDVPLDSGADVPLNVQRLPRTRILSLSALASTLGRVNPSPPNDSVPNVVQRWLLETYAPACVVIDRKLDIVYFHGDTTRYLRPAPGVPTVSLLAIARPELRLDLHACVLQALAEGRTVVRDARVDAGRRVRLVARPLVELGRDSFHLIVFQEEGAAPARASRRQDPSPAGDPAMKQIELELKRAQEQLQLIATEFQSSTEDLRASNEELLSMNEELQSSNEELETTKEELSSSNEELETVNAELSSKLEELAQANSDVRNLLENTRIATLFLNNELRIMNFTPTTAELFALRNSDRGRPIEHIAQRFNYEHVQRDAKQVIDSLSPREAQVQSHGGRWFMMRILPYRSVTNVIEGVVVTFTDISELKKAELDVQRLSLAYEGQLRWLKALIDVVPVGIAYHEKRMRGVRLNNAAVQALSLPLESLTVGAEPLGFEAWAEGSIDPAHAPFQSAVSAESRTRDLEIELGSGESSRHLVLRSAPLVDASASIYGQVSAFVDITEIRRARELAMAREQQQAIIAELGLRALDHGDLASFLCEGLSTLCRAARADACDLMRLSESRDVLVSSCSAGFSRRDAQLTEVVAPESPAATALRRGDPILFQRSEGHEGWPEYLDEEGLESGVRVAITSENRQPFGLLGLYTRTPRQFSKHDLHFLRAGALVITSAIQRQLIEDARLREREAAAVRRAEEQLRRAERLASLGTFAAGIAHELNNPLNNISLAADYAERCSDVERRNRLLATIKSNAQRSGQIVESVLRFARDEVTERRALLPEPVIRRSIDLVRSEFKADRLTVKLKVAEQLPNICGNATELEQVFVNLLRNAVEAHHGHCHIEVEVAVKGPYLRIVVSDDGPGIAARDLPHVFDPFFSTRRKQGGTGLGLSITHRIVAAHGGAIRVATDRALGTAFEIELPLAPEGCES